MNPVRAAARWHTRRVLRCSRAGLVHVQRALLATAAREAVEQTRVRLDGRRPTVAELRVLGAALAVAAGPFSDPPVRSVRFAGRGLTVVNAVQLAVVLGSQLPGLPFVAVLLAACGAAAQAVLAVDVGRRLRPFVGRPPTGPPLPAVAGAGLLAFTSGLACFAAGAWAQAVGSGSLGSVAGLLLGASALAAPFLLISDEVHGPGPHRRLLSRVERILDRRNARCRWLERRAARSRAAAGRMLWRAEAALVVTVDLLGADHLIVGTLSAAVGRLRDELRGEQHAGTGPPPDPEDLDPEGLDPEDLDLAG